MNAQTSPAGSPTVHRPTPTATWRKIHNWGPQLGDTREYYVSRTVGHIVIRKAGDSIEVPLELATWLADAVAQAAVWTDGSPAGEQP